MYGDQINLYWHYTYIRMPEKIILKLNTYASNTYIIPSFHGHWEEQ